VGSMIFLAVPVLEILLLFKLLPPYDDIEGIAQP
jgi:hypothetical protein